MLTWIILLVIVLVVGIILCIAGFAGKRMFFRRPQMLLRSHLQGTIPTSVYPIDLKRVPPPSVPQKGIPKRIFRTSKDNSWKLKCTAAYTQTAKILPDWTQTVYTDQMCHTFVRDVYSQYPDIQDAYDLCNYGVMKADFWRYLVIYHYGGLYLDMKSAVTHPIPLDMNVSKAYVGYWPVLNHAYLFGGYGECQQWWVLAPPKSEFLWKVIWQVTRNLLYMRDHQGTPDFVDLVMVGPKDTKSKILCATGPIVYTYIAKLNDYTVLDINQEHHAFLTYVFTYKEYSNTVRSHYSQQTKPLIDPKVATQQLARPLHFGLVPQVVHLTYRNAESVPSYVWDNLKKYTKDIQVRFYTKEDCDFYLWNHYGAEVLQCWHAQENDTLKANLFQYAVLWREGGMYLDIKTDLRQPLAEMFKSNIPFTSVETRDPTDDRMIQNGILGAAANHPILYNALLHACQTHNLPNTRYLHTMLQLEVDGKTLHIGHNFGRRTFFALHEEQDNAVVRADGTLVAHTQYSMSESWTYVPSAPVQIQNRPVTQAVFHNLQIPQHIYQTHEKRDVTPGLANATRKMKAAFPNCSYTFFDAEERRAFIETHYPQALDAYDTLIPGAYQSDLFRTIILYVKGGLYFDCALSPVDRWSATHYLRSTDLFVSPLEGLLNGCIACVPNHPLVRQTLEKILSNIAARELYLDDPLGQLRITGPLAWKDAFNTLYNTTEIQSRPDVTVIQPGEHPSLNGVIFVEGRPVFLTRYAGYDEDRQFNDKDSVHYSDAWHDKAVFKPLPSSE